MQPPHNFHFLIRNKETKPKTHDSFEANADPQRQRCGDGRPRCGKQLRVAKRCSALRCARQRAVVRRWILENWHNYIMPSFFDVKQAPPPEPVFPISGLSKQEKIRISSAVGGERGALFRRVFITGNAAVFPNLIHDERDPLF